MKPERLAMVVALGAAIGASSSAAHAQACNTLTNPVIVAGSTAIKTLVQNIAPSLAMASGSDQLTIVLASAPAGSCAGVAALAADTTPTGTCAAGACATGTGTYWNTTGCTTPPCSHTCNLDPAGSHIDLALSDVFPVSCAGVDTSSLQATETVVLPFAFLVPHASTQVAIDTREAYFAFGFGSAGMVTPWSVENYLFHRNSGSGTQVTIGRALTIPETRFSYGFDVGGTGNMITTVAAAGAGMFVTPPMMQGANAEATLGFAGMDAADAHRDTITELAYRHWGQNNYYWADSQHNLFDKKNIRDGHYPLWSYEQAVVRVDGSHMPTSARGALLAQIVAGTHSVSTLSILDQTIAAHLVPTCAMEVSRTTDGGDFSLYTDPAPCECYFDAHVTSGTTTCTACTTDSMCGAGHCRHNYCEAN
jgi:hypothetical protein